MKNFSLDSRAARVFKRARLDQFRDRDDIGRRRTVVDEHRHARSHEIMNIFQRRRRCKRREQVDRLARAQQLDRDDLARTRRGARMVRVAVAMKDRETKVRP